MLFTLKKILQPVFQMDEALSSPTGPEAKSPVPVGEADVNITGREPSSHLHQAATGQGTRSWPPETVAWGSQNSFTPAMKSAKSPWENYLGNSRAVSGNGQFLWGGPVEESLEDLIRSLRKARGKNDVSRESRKVTSLLEQDPKIDVNKLVDDQPIIHDACRHDQWGLLNVILARPNVDVNIRDTTNSRTPLHVAAIQGDSNSMIRLLDMDGIDMKARDAEGYIPLHYAVEPSMQPLDIWSFSHSNEHDVLFRLCANGAVNTRTSQKTGPLHIASKAGNIAALKILLSQPDLEINMTDVRGETALHQAKDATIAGMLLEKGLNANIQNVDGNTALHCALEQDSKELVSLLLKNTKLDRDVPNSEGEQFMHMAAAKWDLETFKQSVSGDINMPDGNGRTVLHIAARVGNMDIVEFLLGPGIESIAASVNSEDEHGQTPLHLACEKGHVDVVERLLRDPSIGANVRDKMRRTPLHLASEKGHPDVVHSLLDSTQVEADVGDVDGWTPIHFAANRGHFDTVLSLLEHGANPRIICSVLLHPDGSIHAGQDAAGVADKIEIRNLVRRYRFRKISLVPNLLSKAQEDLFKRHGNDVYAFWKWPSKDDLPDEYGNVSRRKRQRNYPDISTVYRIYDRPVCKSQALEPCEEEQWQLRHGFVENVARFDSWSIKDSRHGFVENGARSDPQWIIKDSKPRFLSYFRERTTKWVHFSAQNVSIIKFWCPIKTISTFSTRQS